MATSIQRLVVMIFALVMLLTISGLSGNDYAKSNYGAENTTYTISLAEWNASKELLDRMESETLDSQTYQFEQQVGDTQSMFKRVLEIFKTPLRIMGLINSDLTRAETEFESVLRKSFLWGMSILLGVLMGLETYFIYINRKHT